MSESDGDSRDENMGVKLGRVRNVPLNERLGDVEDRVEFMPRDEPGRELTLVLLALAEPDI